VLFHSDVAHRIGRIAQRLRCRPTGDDDVLFGRAAAQHGQDGCDIEPAVFEGVSHFVEDDEPDAGIAEVFASDLPGEPGGRSIALLVLGFPGKTCPAYMPGDTRLGPEKGFFTAIGTSFHKLHDRDPHAVSQGARDDAKGGGRLALAVAGIDYQHTALDLRRGDLPVNDFLLLLHSFCMGNHEIFPTGGPQHRTYPACQPECALQGRETVMAFMIGSAWKSHDR